MPFINYFLNYFDCFTTAFPYRCDSDKKRPTIFQKTPFIPIFRYSSFYCQNHHFQTHNRKPDFEKNSNKDSCKPSLITDPGKSTYAQILAKFISNINLAKHAQQSKSKSRSHYRKVLSEQNQKPKRIRKTSENTSFDEEKKIEHIKPAFTQSKLSPHKIRQEEKGSKASSTFSIPKTSSGFNIPQNKRKEASEQNIINNCFMGPSFNMNDYARFIQSPYFLLNQQIMSNWFQMNPFMVPNIPQLTSLAEGMKNGLTRQLEIYERFKPHSNPSQFEKSRFQTPPPPEKCEEKMEKISSQKQGQKRMSPDKIFKRASYHVGIAYSIYMDGIQKQGKKIKNYEEIDPTRHAKKYKAESQKSR